MRMCIPPISVLGALAWSGCGGSGLADPDSAAPLAPCGGESVVFTDISDTMSMPRPAPGEIGERIDCALIVDLDRDGYEDLGFGWESGLHLRWGGADSYTIDWIDEDPRGCLAVDLDGNGLRDLVLPRGLVVLYQDAPREFTAARDALQWPHDGEPGRATAAADFDGDGLLDLFIGGRFEPTPPFDCTTTDTDITCTTEAAVPAPDAILIQGSDHIFATSAALTVGGSGHALGALAVDLDGDAAPDLLVVNDFSRNDLYLSSEGYVDVAEARGLGDYNHGMGVGLGDLDGDGNLDLYISDIGPDGLFLGSGDGSFASVGQRMGTTGQTFDRYGWGVVVEDLDNDGDDDMFVANGYTAAPGLMEEMLESILSGEGPQGEDPDEAALQVMQDYAADEHGHDLGLQCEGTLLFQEVPSQALPALVRESPAAAGDLDGDGDIDLLVVTAAGGPVVFRNDTDALGHWLELDLMGAGANGDAIGARIEIQTEDRLIRRWLTSGSSGGHGSHLVHVGLGEATAATVEVSWPGGATSSQPLAADHRFSLSEPAD